MPKRLTNPRGRAFPQLLFAIFNQQVSVAAADSIARKFLDTSVRLRAHRESQKDKGAAGPDPVASELEAAFGDAVRSDPDVPPRAQHPDWPEPEFVLSMSSETLRSVGLSGRKVEYAHATAQACLPDAPLSEASIQEMTADELRAAIVAVRGLGPWTADLFLMFYAGHKDVIPVGDLGIRRSYGLLRGKGAVPSPAEVVKGTEHWSPHRTVGALLLWELGWELAAAAKTRPKATKNPRGPKRTAGRRGDGELAEGAEKGSEEPQAGEAAVAARETAASGEAAGQTRAHAASPSRAKPRRRPRKWAVADAGAGAGGSLPASPPLEAPTPMPPSPQAPLPTPLPRVPEPAIAPEIPQKRAASAGTAAREPVAGARRSPRLRDGTVR